MAITSPGIGSNLDVNGIINQLMSIERQPLNKLDYKEASYQAKLSAIGSVKGALSSIQSALTPLTKAATFSGSYKASSGDSTVVSASASDKATTGSYSVSVEQLAQSQKLRTANTFAGINTAVGSGKITIQFGTTTPANGDPKPDELTLAAGFEANANRTATTITIDPGKNTLLDIRDAINKGNAGVTASIVNDGTGYRLAIASSDPGAANSLKITVDDDDVTDTDAAGLSTLAFDPATAGPRNLLVSQAAKSARLTIDGIPVVKSTNTVTDAIDGVTLNLQKVGGPTSVGVSFDRSGISSSIQSFVKAYNDANKSLRDLGAYNPESKSAGPLQGDPMLRTVQSQLRAALRGDLTYSAGGFKNLAEIGISYSRDGAMTLDQAKLNSAISDQSKDVGALFTSIAKASDSGVSVLTPPKGTLTGRYAVSVSQLATQGTGAGALASRLVSSGVNDQFSIAVDGITASVTLSQGNYSGAGLAAEIQSKVNGVTALKSAGSSIKVEYSGQTTTLTGNQASSFLSLGVADYFDVTLGGVAQQISMNAGTDYSDLSAVAADIQTKINAAYSAQGYQVTVQESGGVFSIQHDESVSPPIGVSGVIADMIFGAAPILNADQTLRITSQKYGQTSTVTSLNSTLVTGFAGTAGVDVAGKIGNADAIASGQELTASGVAEGLKIKVTSGALGDRGYVTQETGFAQRLNDLLTGLVNGNGVISSKSKGIQSSIDQLDDRREVLSRRLGQIEARYRSQFTSLDKMMSQMTQTSNYLGQQLSRLPGASSGGQ